MSDVHVYSKEELEYSFSFTDDEKQTWKDIDEAWGTGIECYRRLKIKLGLEDDKEIETEIRTMELIDKNWFIKNGKLYSHDKPKCAFINY